VGRDGSSFIMRLGKKRIIWYAVAGGVSLWIVDALIDSLLFSEESFLDSLILHASPHELYFRGLFLIAFIAFGMFMNNTTARQERIDQELQKAVVKIEEGKARFESIVAAIGDGISIQDREFKVIYQNQVHVNIVGGVKTGQYCYQAYSQVAAICLDCPVALAYQDGEIHSLERTLVRGKERKVLEIKASPLRDAEGNIIAGIEAVRDITDRKRVEEKLKLFSEAIEEAMDGVQIVGLDGHVVYSNKAVQEIYGFSPEELAGRHVNEMNADPEFADRVIIPRMKEAGRWSGEILVKHKNGKIFPVWLATAIVKDASGTPIAMIGIIRDITERKQAEEILNRHREQLVKLVEERTHELSSTNEKLRREIADRERMEEELLKAQKLESLGILAGGIAHDFNNLLASILGNISLAMLDLDRSHGAFNQLVGAEKASLRAQDLTRQLLTFSKGGAPLKKTSDIADLVREAAGFALRGSRVKYELSLAPDLKLAEVDEGQISQVIHNLAINADHAMPEGGTVSIACSNCDVGASDVLPLREGTYVRISVTDHGVGIPRAHLTKIFDPYFTTKQKGSGLGLATSYSIVKKHGGHITVNSEQGVGTTFDIYLPASRETKVKDKLSEGALRWGTGTVLLMDDEPEVRETTGAVLRKLGYEVAFAVDGTDAIEQYRRALDTGRPFGLVIMDLTVPGGMGGKETLKRLREIDPGVKAIVSSGYSNDPIMADFGSHGFNGVVAKPFRIKDLGDEVYRVMNGK